MGQSVKSWKKALTNSLANSIFIPKRKLSLKKQKKLLKQVKASVCEFRWIKSCSDSPYHQDKLIRFRRRENWTILAHPWTVTSWHHCKQIRESAPWNPRMEPLIYHFRKCWSHWLPVWGGEGWGWEKVGPLVKWASRYYWYYICYVNQYACGFSSFLALLIFFVLYFKIF